MAATAQPIRIIACRVVARAQDGNGDSGLVAIIDAIVPSFVLHGCELYRRRNLSLVISPPRGIKGDYSGGVKFTDDAMRAELLRVACIAAGALGANVQPGPPLSHGFSEAGERLFSGDA